MKVLIPLIICMYFAIKANGEPTKRNIRLQEEVKISLIVPKFDLKTRYVVKFYTKNNNKFVILSKEYDIIK